MRPPIDGPSTEAPDDGRSSNGLSTDALVGLVARLGSMETATGDAERIDRIAALERLKGAAAAAQARESVQFDASQRAAQVARGVAPELVGRGIADQVALARSESPHAGSRLLGLAKALVHEMPQTLATLTTGETSEWRATVMARETACLSVEDRRRVDAEIGPHLADLGNGAVERAARMLAQRLDAAAAVARASRAAQDRRVTIRPAPDTMTFLTAHLPVADGVAVYAALDAAARRLVSTGDGRGRGQIMADTLVERLTGRAHVSGHPVEIGLVMTDRALLGGADDPAMVAAPGVGPVPLPAALARRLVTPSDLGATIEASSPEREADESARLRAKVWVRRLYTTPDGRDLVATDSRRRSFDGALRRMLVLRDQTCRTPHCDAPIRQGDHVRPYRADGPTSLANSAGLCQRCNQVKETPGWATQVDSPGPTAADAGGLRPTTAQDSTNRPTTAHRTTITTPTGHTYRSVAPPLLPGRPTSQQTTPPTDPTHTPPRHLPTRAETYIRCALRPARRVTRDHLATTDWSRLLAEDD